MGSANKPRISHPGPQLKQQDPMSRRGRRGRQTQEARKHGTQGQVEHLRANAFGARQLNCQKI